MSLLKEEFAKVNTTTKYDWSNVPSHIMWIATDNNGFKSGFTDDPVCESEYGFWDNGLPSLPMHDSEFQGNWQDSLEERPNDH